MRWRIACNSIRKVSNPMADTEIKVTHRHPKHKKLVAGNDGKGMLTSTDNGKTWYFTFRSTREIEVMGYIPVDNKPTVDEAENTRMQERELFGETLDEELPDDLCEMLGI
jgi:hypothetical protein